MPSVSFVMPMYNEAENIERTILKVKDVASGITNDFEIIVVDDASKDGSADLVLKIADRDRRVKCFRLLKNTKFGGAFAECFKNASKDIIIYMDSDMPVSQNDIKEAFTLINDTDIVTGYSKVKKGDTIARKFMSGVYNMIVQLLFSLNVKDINSGFKIVKRELVKDLNFISRSPFIDVEIFIHAREKGASVKQYPLIFLPREGGKSHIAAFPIIVATFRDILKVFLNEIFNYKR